MNDKSIIGGIVVLILAVGGVLFVLSGGVTTPKEDNAPKGALALAQCLADSDATFYGAFWCPHCNSQKELFGSAEKVLPYTECSTPDSKAQTQVCIDAGIKSYPTWQFKDGTQVTGVQTFAELAQKSGCPLTAGSATDTSTPSIEVSPNVTTVETPTPTLSQ